MFLATTAHEGQVDKLGEPYLRHVLRVARRVTEHVHNNIEMHTVERNQIIAIAYLHDVIEDTKITADVLLSHFNSRIVDAVVALTHLPNEYSYDYLDRVKLNRDAVIVKLADVADNMDPYRLQRLDPATRERLIRKYTNALEALLS